MTEHRIEAIGDSLTFEGVTYKKTDGLGTICRLLVERGVPFGDVAHVYRGEQLCLVGCIHTRAERTLREDDTGFSMVKYRPFKGIKEKI